MLTISDSESVLQTVLSEEPQLKACRQKFTFSIQSVSVFCAEAHITTARFAEVEAGAARPSPLLLAYVWSRVRHIEQTLASVEAALQDRIAYVADKLPPSFELPEYSTELAPQYSAWQLPRLTFTWGRVTQSALVRDAQLTKAYVSIVEHGRANLTARLAVQYMTHLASELSYVQSTIEAVAGARSRLEAVAPESGVRHAG